MINFKRKPHGFSLIEILVSFCLVATLVLFGFQSTSTFFEHRKQRAYMLALFHDLKWSRMEAIILRTAIIVSPQGDWCQGWRIHTDVRLLKVQEKSDVCHIRFTSFPNVPEVTFSPDGRSDYQNGTFYFYEGDQVRMKIIMNQAGRIRREEVS